jgi:hypothetical protein
VAQHADPDRGLLVAALGGGAVGLSGGTATWLEDKPRFEADTPGPEPQSGASTAGIKRTFKIIERDSSGSARQSRADQDWAPGCVTLVDQKSRSLGLPAPCSSTSLQFGLRQLEQQQCQRTRLDAAKGDHDV